MTRRLNTKLVPVLFGELPAKAINEALGLELDAGQTAMSVNAQRHAQRRHPANLARCFPHIASVIANPLYARDDFANDGKIELVGRPPALGDYMLVAVEISRDSNGRYNVVFILPGLGAQGRKQPQLRASAARAGMKRPPGANREAVTVKL